MLAVGGAKTSRYRPETIIFDASIAKMESETQSRQHEYCNPSGTGMPRVNNTMQVGYSIMTIPASLLQVW